MSILGLTISYRIIEKLPTLSFRPEGKIFNYLQAQRFLVADAPRNDKIQSSHWVATDHHDITAEQIAFAYKLRWNIEIFFGWWKCHLKVYHLISRSQYGLMVQMLAGLITYILLAIYCHDQYHENVSVKRLREISINIRNEMSLDDIVNETGVWYYQPSKQDQSYANL